MMSCTTDISGLAVSMVYTDRDRAESLTDWPSYYFSDADDDDEDFDSHEWFARMRLWFIHYTRL